jgi:2-methylcitrate dehydratase PrpD
MISEDLAAFVSNLRFEQIPENVVARVKDLVLDNIGCAFGGIAIPPTLKIYDTEQGARVLYDILRLHFSPGKATVWGRNLKTSCLLAAFINAATSNSPEYDDTILLLHPGTVVIPSAMAVGEVEDVNGRNIVEAIVSGYEVSIRIMQCLGVSHRERGWRATGTVGTFGAAAAASKILNLDIEKTATALGLAGCQAAGLWARGTMTRVLDAGRAAYGGVLSALLAQEGFSGPHGIFDAQDNFCKATSDGYDLSKMTEGLHVNYEILRVGMKPYSTARALHAPIDGVIELMEKHSIRPREIDRMIVRTDGITARDCARYEPGNVRSAMQSLPYSIALAVVDKKLLMPILLSEEQFRDPQILSLAKRVILESDPRFPSLPYRGNRPCEVEIRTKDGKKYLQYVAAPKGEPENPLTKTELYEKFKRLVEPLLGATTAIEIMKRVDQIEKLGKVEDLTSLLI